MSGGMYSHRHMFPERNRFRPQQFEQRQHPRNFQRSVSQEPGINLVRQNFQVDGLDIDEREKNEWYFLTLPVDDIEDNNPLFEFTNAKMDATSKFISALEESCKSLSDGTECIGTFPFDSGTFSELEKHRMDLDSKRGYIDFLDQDISSKLKQLLDDE